MMKQREIEERAAYWLIEQDDPDFNEERRALFVLWLSESPKHRDTYLALERAWHRTLVLRKKPVARNRLCQEIAHRLMSTRNLDVHDAERLTQGAFAVLRAAHHAPDFEYEPLDFLQTVVARNITRDWFCFTFNYDKLLETCSSEHRYPFHIGTSFPTMCRNHAVTTAEHGHLSIHATAFNQLVGLALELNGLLEGAVANLASCTRHVFTLRKVHGLSEDEIAGELNLTPATVGEHLDQAAYQCATHLVDTLPPERQTVLFATLDACHLTAKRRALT